MAWNGSGTYNKGNLATGGWVGDAAANIPIQASRHDTQDNDFASGINNCLAKDGQNAMSGDLNMGAQKIKNLALGTAAAPAIYPDADTNTGIFSPGADSLALSTGGTERLRINTTDITVNNLKITGVATPTGSTDVATKGYTDAAVTSGLDGDKGDITVSASATTWTIDNRAVTYAKIQDVSGTDKLLGRSSAGAGVVEEITCTVAGRALLDDIDAAEQRTTLGAASASHTHAAADITSGTIATARLGTGTADSTTYLRGDQTWATGATSKTHTLGVIYDQFVPQTTASWNAVEYAPSLGLWCVVGSTGTRRVVTSSDGKTWTLRTESQTNSWRGIAWAPSLSLFAAVSSDGTNRVMTSPDGINWTNRTAAAANSWRDVAWSSTLGLFAAVSDSGTGNRIMTSPDGITWTSRTSAADSSWYRIKWINELSLFVAVGIGTTTTSIMTSANGTTWTARTTPGSTYIDLVYFPEASVLVVSDSADTTNSGGILTSSDGFAYSQGSLNMKDAGGRLYGIEYITSSKCLVFGYYDGVTTLIDRAGRAFSTTGGNSYRLGRAVDLNRIKYAATPDLIVAITNTRSLFISGLG